MAKSQTTADDFRNLGPISIGWLRQIGIQTPRDLALLGAVPAFLMIEALGVQPTKNLLYALQGCIDDRAWRSLSASEKQILVSDLNRQKSANLD